MFLLMLAGALWGCKAPPIALIVECRFSSECTGGAVCELGECVECSDDRPCGDSLYCDRGRCVECMTPLECGADALCREGVCYYSLTPDVFPNRPPVCTPGRQRCEGALLQICGADARAWSTQRDCLAPALCGISGTGAGNCLEPPCAHGQASCNGPELRRCNSDRSGWSAVDTCPSPAHCDSTASSCLSEACEPGRLRCNVGRFEQCNESSTDWELVDECQSNQLCEITLARAILERMSGSAASGSSAGASTETSGFTPVSCIVPECVDGERRCIGDRLEFCNEGRTGWELAETCGTPTLCENSLAFAGTGERPRCVRAACDAGEHECTESGVLQVCDEERDGFRFLEACLGPAFCNSVEADQGRPGCLDAPCAPGQMQCNGPQREVCRADSTGFDPVGTPCESRDLCNDDDPAAAVCRQPACARGPGSTTEFRCQGAVLERCNEQHTGFEASEECESAALCDAPNGTCRALICEPGELRCSFRENVAVLEACNETTGFAVIVFCRADEKCSNETASCEPAEVNDAGAVEPRDASGVIADRADL